MIPPARGRGLAAVAALAATVVGAAVAARPRGAGEPPAQTTLRVECVVPAAVQSAARDKATILYEDFDRSDSPGARWFEYDRAGGSFVRAAGEGIGERGGAMRATFEKGQVAAGSLKALFGRNPFGKGIRQEETFREVYWRVYVKHEPGWTGNPAKLARATCLAGTDWSQGMIAHVWGGKGDALCIDPATGIVDNRKVTEKYNDFAHLKWLGLRNGETPIFSAMESGRWVCVESHVRLNTPGKSDGVFELWIDGKPEAARTDLDWHGTWSDYGIDAIFLENYWNTGSVRRQTRWLDDFVISTRPIGPVTAAQSVTVMRTAGTAAAWEVQCSTRPDEGGVVWTSGPASGGARSLRIDARQGAFIGARSRQRDLAPDTTYWLRIRQRTPAGYWLEWTDWHAPFRAAP